MGCSTYLGLGWRYQPLAPGHPTSICDIGVNDYLGKADLSKGYWNPKRKLGDRFHETKAG